MMFFFQKNSVASISEIDQINKRCYDACADYWDRFPFPNHLPHLLSQINTTLLGNKVLDIGSGTGRVAEYLRTKGFDVTCLDPSDEMVRRTREKGLHTVQTTFQNFETSESYGTAIAILSLIHVPKVEFKRQLERIANLLNPNGLLVLSLLAGDSEGFEESRSSYPRFFSRFTHESIQALSKDLFVELEFHKFEGGYLLFLLRKLQ